MGEYMTRFKNILLIILLTGIMTAPSCYTDNNSADALKTALFTTDTTSGNVVETGDSCKGCPGQLTNTDAEKITETLDNKNVSGNIIELNVKIKIPKADNPYATSDGELWATIIRPAGGEKLPTILQVTPYGREIMMMFSLGVVGNGYNFIVVDIRGTGSSGGPWASFGMAEQYDTRYIIDTYIPAQTWSDGKVGMIGGSYEAISQFLAAGLVDIDAQTGEPVHLKAIFPKAPMADAAGDIAIQGGMMDLLFVPAWIGIVDMIGAFPPMLLLGENGRVTKENIAESMSILQEHVNYITTTIGWVLDPKVTIRGDFLDERSSMMYWPMKPAGGWRIPEGNTNSISSRLPVFETGGWYCIFTRGTANHYAYGLKNHAPTDKKMIIGEYYHLEAATGIGNNAIISGRLPLRWFDWKIKKKDDPFMEEFPVLLYVMGEDRWRAEKSWPLPASRLDRKTLYLTKHAPTPIDGDWYTEDRTLLKIYRNNNYALSETPDYSGENPVLKHNPVDLLQGINLHGGNSRESVRWFFGFQGFVPDVYKWYLGDDFVAKQWYEDERRNEKEGLTFTTEPLEQDVNITGPIALTFWAKTDFTDPLTTTMTRMILDYLGETMRIQDTSIMRYITKKDVQWISSLDDVFPDGRARNITMGWLSAWCRQYDPAGATGTAIVDGDEVVEHRPDPAYVPFDPFYFGPEKNPKAINEGELYRYTVELWPTCNTFRKGHRIRVSLLNSDFPHFLPTFQSSNSTIVIDADHPAKLDFTATNTAGEGSTWKMIGTNEDADNYLLNGGKTGCGSVASAAQHRGTAAGYASEAMGLLGMMLLPLGLMAVTRRFRNRRPNRG